MPGSRDMEMAAAACFPQHAGRIIDLADVLDRYIQMGDMPRKPA